MATSGFLSQVIVSYLFRDNQFARISRQSIAVAYTTPSSGVSVTHQHIQSAYRTADTAAHIAEQRGQVAYALSGGYSTVASTFVNIARSNTGSVLIANNALELLLAVSPPLAVSQLITESLSHEYSTARNAAFHVNVLGYNGPSSGMAAATTVSIIQSNNPGSGTVSTIATEFLQIDPTSKAVQSASFLEVLVQQLSFGDNSMLVIVN